MLYFADEKWWQWHQSRDEFKSFAGERCTIFSTGMMVDDSSIHMLLNDGSDGGISTDPRSLRTGLNSGHQAINIAALAGAKRIVLVGYDARSHHGKAHFFGEHPDKTSPPYPQMITNMRIASRALVALGVDVVNCSPGSAIDAFEKATLDEVFS